MSTPQPETLQHATFGSGCFWCTEAVFQRLAGVQQVIPGYAGGNVDSPTYQQVCSGTTGHAEVIQIAFDSDQISFDELLDVFWQTHDPTTLNRQGADVGSQYRSVIFHHDDQQRSQAEKFKQQLDQAGVFSSPIVTEITPLSTFYPAEIDHHNYYNLNGGQGYCRAVIRPKVDKFTQRFRDKLKQG